MRNPLYHNSHMRDLSRNTKDRLSEYLAYAALHQHMAFTLKSESARTKHARAAAYWYEAAQREREMFKNPLYQPGMPYWKLEGVQP